MSVHLEKFNSIPLVKIHNSESILIFACVISSLVGVFRSLSYEDDLKETAVFIQALDKIPAIIIKYWSSFTIKRNWYCPNLLDFNEWLKKAETHERMKIFPVESKPSNPSRQKLPPKILLPVLSRASSNNLPGRSALLNVRYGDALNLSKEVRTMSSCMVQTAFFLLERKKRVFYRKNSGG